MAQPTLSTEAVEESTYVIAVAFTDEAGTAVVPNAGLTWTLTDEAGTVVNSRSAVAIASAATVTIVLSGDDLEIGATETAARRLLTVQGTYNSTAGSNLPLREEVLFTVRGLAAVT